MQNASDHYHFVDWRVRGQYDFNPDHMLYGLIADGHKAGGFNDNLGTGGPVLTYNPEEVTNFEIGSKNRFTVAGAPVKLNVSAFYMAYKNQQITDLQTLNQESALLNVTPSSGGAVVVDYTFNAAQSAIMGATFEGNIAIPQAKMNLGFNVLWMPEAKVTGAQTIEDSRFQSDVDPDNAGQVSIQGHRLPRTPRLGMNLNLAQKFQTSAGGFDYVVAPGYRSSSHATIYNGVDYAAEACAAGGTILDANGNAVSGCTAVAASPNRARLNDTLAGYWTLDVGGGYTNPNGRLRLEAYVNNIVKQPVSGLVISETGGTVAFLPRPTTYGLRARMRF
jgi:iron complex outermembrane receptor protein